LGSRLIDLVEQGYFLFDEDRMGEFVFGTVSGFIDYRFGDNNGVSRVEFSWEGTSDTDPACGRGWFELRENNKLYGKLFIHNGDDSWVEVEKQ